jgi:hypothetical protein
MENKLNSSSSNKSIFFTATNERKRSSHSEFCASPATSKTRGSQGLDHSLRASERSSRAVVGSHSGGPTSRLGNETHGGDAYLHDDGVIAP